ncbi:MAG: class I SAM-dependent methyltransferase [Actinobacteria bacterium]|nr:class I SAM-dependent methyltransferase [Actinomycetota bacterium]
MLTVDFERLDLKGGHRVLDMGAGAGRHAYEALRRGATIVAFDYSLPELKQCMATYYAMDEAGELQKSSNGQGGTGTTTRGDALKLPFPDDSFDRIIASEVMEHIPDDSTAATELFRVLKPGGTIAVTVPAWFPEQVCWKLSDAYHAPIAVGGHVRIYREREMRNLLSSKGFETKGTHQAHALHSPYWWLKCAVGPTNNDNPLVKQYLRFLTWDIVKAPKLTRLADKMLNPLIGKSVVHYAVKPARRPSTSEVADAA